MQITILSVLCCNASTTRQQRSFPDDFIFGTATASYQIEGAWNEDDKGENIWDRMTHTQPEVIKDRSNGDVAADSYHNYKRDVEMMRELGLDAYRFSFSWSRLLPTGFTNKISEAGLTFYNNYINEMLKYNIEPMATMYHWDLPQKLQDLGGFANPHFVDWFEDYARVLYENFGDRIKFWITFNEPKQICEQGYGDVVKAPILNATGIGEYICAKHLSLAHARAYHAYVNDYKDTQGGVCGITINVSTFEPDTDTDEDRFATELRKQAEWAIYAEPIFSKEGGFPKELSERVSMKSAAQGYPRSRLPDFTEEEKVYIRGASDFFGINHYTAFFVSANSYKTERAVPSILDDIDVGYYQRSDWPKGASTWMYLAPNSLYKAIMDLKDRYNNPDIYVTENGWSTTGGLDDDDRITYYRAALEDVLGAIEDGVNLKGYMAWSLLDNYEWMQGYTERFGLYEVDFESPMRTRTPRKSAFVYKQIIKTRVIDHQYEPETLTMTIDEGH